MLFRWFGATSVVLVDSIVGLVLSGLLVSLVFKGYFSKVLVSVCFWDILIEVVMSGYAFAYACESKCEIQVVDGQERKCV
jgi:hypothetical protein